MSFGDLRCNSRLGRTFHHVASMYYIFTNFSKWLPRSSKKKKKNPKNNNKKNMFGRYKFVAIHRILLTVKMIRLRKQTSDFRLTSVQIVWKIADVIFVSWCYTTPLLRKESIRDSVTLFISRLCKKLVQRELFVLNKCLTPLYCSLCPDLQIIFSSCHFNRRLHMRHA